MHTTLRALLLGVALALGAPLADATTLAPLSQDQIVDAADAIVRGEVLSVESVLLGKYVWTHAQVRVEKVYKGVVNAETITIESLGGEHEGTTFDVDGAARYSPGEEIIAFITGHPSRGTWGTVGMFLGKYTIRQNPTDGSEMVVRFAVPYSTPYDARFVPAPPKDQRISVRDFERAVSARVELGWDGQPIPGVSDNHLRQINKLQPGVR